MKTGLLILLFAGAMANPAEGAADMDTLRRHFRLSLTDIEQAQRLYSELSRRTAEGKNPLLLAYMGAVQAQLARHTWSPVRKLQYLQLADQTLRQALAMEPNNPEIRFLRFSYQHHVPEFLGLSQDLETDRSYLVSFIAQDAEHNLDMDLVQEMKEFLTNSGRCTLEELEIMGVEIH